MKKLVALILVFFPMYMLGQTTDAKDEALSAVSKFCTLLSQYSNGGTTYLNNDRKIFDLCSSQKISTFDDIKSNKEVMLNSYLSLITRQYKNHLKMSFSQPQFVEALTIPTVQLIKKYQNFEGGLALASQDLKVDGNLDVYILIDVEQTIPSLGIQTKRKFIYSVVEHKLLAFIVGNSPFIMMCNAIKAYSENNLGKALNYCDKALANERFDKKSACAGLAMGCCVKMNNYRECYKYTPYLGEQKEIYNTLVDCMLAIESKDMNKAFGCLQILAESKVANYSDCQALLANFYANGYGCTRNRQKALDWYRSANKEGSAIAGYMFWIDFRYVVDKDDENLDFKEGEIYNFIKTSAERGCLPSFYEVALCEANFNNTEKEGYWYKKGAELGDIKGFVSYGLWLSSVKHNKQEAIYWLKKAINSSNLSFYLKHQDIKKYGMETVDDIKKLLYCVEHDIPVPLFSGTKEQFEECFRKVSEQMSSGSTNIPHSSSSYSNSSYTGSNTSSSTSYTQSSYTYRKRSKPFNCPNEDHPVAGFSVGYVQKQWSVKSDGEKFKVGYWDDSKFISGVQAGIRVEPLFKYGFGIDTGLYYEFYYSKSKPQTSDGVEFSPSMQDHSLYLPIHAEYRLNFSDSFQAFFYGGVGFDLVVASSIKTNSDILEYEDDDAYHSLDFKKFNASVEFGGGLRYSCFQLNFTMSKGLLKMNNSDEIMIKQNKMMCNLSVMF